MARNISVAFCPVSQSDVVRVTDLEGRVTRLVCVDYDEPTGNCLRKASEAGGGPLARFLSRTRERTLASHGVRCDLA